MNNTQIKNLSSATTKITKLWLILAVAALAIAGLFSLPPVVLRGPFFADKFDVEHIFATSLVIHVDQSVIIWMTAIAAALWTLFIGNNYQRLNKILLYIAALGTLLIALSPFIEHSNPIKNNYVPVLDNISFFIGLGLFALAIFSMSVLVLLKYQNVKGGDAISFGLYAGAFITVISFICFAIAYIQLPEISEVGTHQYYELLFWGGGHILQYVFTTILLSVWLLLGNACGNSCPIGDKYLKLLFLFYVFAVLPAPLFYIFSDTIYDTITIFADHMRYFMGLPAALIGISLLFKIFKKSENFLLKSVMVLSILLFGYGGVLAFMISGTNVTIPAHYHGSIVGITLAFMGLCYYYFPKLGGAEFRGRFVNSQPYIYGVGQFCHITGLAWMGGYGALRKAPGTIASVDSIAAKSMFFLGGSLAIVGGLMFVIIMIKNIYFSNVKKP
ncbi:cbb3-type cytochrome c oxidase subunit I [Rickettsiales bacterium]|nr:cbb3-type cytochrome c oxidase subunit I [Rickettsiales bacterium]